MVARIVGAEQRGRPAELALEVGASAVALAALQFLAGTDSPCIAVAVRILACDAQRHVCGERRVDDGLGTIGAKAAVGRLERALEAVARAVGVEGADTRRSRAAIERPFRTGQHRCALDDAAKRRVGTKRVSTCGTRWGPYQ